MSATYKSNWDLLRREEIIDVAERMNGHYVAAMAELNRYRDMLDKVKPEDLHATVRERELALKNQAELCRQLAERERRRADLIAESVKKRAAEICEQHGQEELAAKILKISQDDLDAS